ncbi:similar to Saccharomyces cerevisiae YBR279W PAF1 Component of the Paf1p complex [Maudiozyma saulgeensis]|uniref:Similar to Saccharomyces cerevisiae YBR279W PAF1 Component of the Paf1p complex n=1 Tax=Maudiozyma saulgeensis TaxID=1789683 RepID=A0A1X7R187_9SACH|nr:similar to Saccharomyces cerevisiae YBR279W PAF1 Component of the Paf1p complex [Kazachstania saulgeensis]
MSRKQEYIARVRYFNNLPAPSVPPKLLNYVTKPDENADAPQLVTALYNKTNITPLINLDNDLGMPLDLMNIPGLLNKNDTKLLYGFENVKLHPDDRVLLRDPRADRLAKTDTAKVSFLRRTEYVSSTNATPAGTGNGKKTGRNIYENRGGLNKDGDDDRILTAPEIVTKVENTFESSAEDLSKLVHPIKRHLKAVESWNLLPDTASMDENYFSLRLVGSAALEKREKDKLALKTAIFRPVELEEDEWISMYTTDKTDSDIISKNIEKVISEKAGDNDENNEKTFKFKRVRDFDMQQAQKTTDEGMPDLDQSRLGELAILFNQERGIAYYKPLRARIELKRRRVNDVLKTIVREHTVDQINIAVRNPTTKEANAVDRLRMKYDPINFVPVDDEDSSNSEDEANKGDSNGENVSSQESSGEK